MSQDQTKTCPDCAGEYELHGEVCADCGKPLVFKSESGALPPPLREQDEGVCLREGRIDDLSELSGLLAKKHIRNVVQLHRESPKAGTARYGLYVLPDDLDAAKEIDRAHWLKGAPEHASSYRYTAQELKGACPACETALPEGVAECPECGLTVGATETAECPACEADVPVDAEKCPNCGAEFE